MKQILQSLKTGECFVEEVPCPVNTAECLLIETSKTLLSSGTERMLLEFGKAGLIGKIKQQPDKVKMVLEKIKTDGLFATLDSVKAKLDQPIPLGYCQIGKVLEVGENVTGYQKGDRVISNGSHAEIVRVPQHLCAKVPDSVSDETAVFTVLSAIALQGVRLSKPALGETYVVIGLGIIGLVAVQLLRANGCRVLGIDFDAQKCELAQSYGAQTVNLSKGEDPISAAELFSRGRGVDSVIITASTKSNEPLHQAATMSRKRGRIVLIGVIGNEWSRADFYEKELSFQVSCSYGPGRYDDDYELRSKDYPYPYVRWTEQRNFEAILDLMAARKLSYEKLMSHQFDIDNAHAAYEVLVNDKTSLGIMLNYPVGIDASKQSNAVILTPRHAAPVNQISVSFIGSGNYATRMLLPAFQSLAVNLECIVSSAGVSGKLSAKKYGFAKAATSDGMVYQDQATQLVVIATRHHLHANQVIESLKAGKHVFVEKPLAINLDELECIKTAYKNAENHSLLLVGFNRRFAPQTQTIKKLLASVKTPKSFIMTINAGLIPKTHWTQQPAVGGGRIIGEACHFIDLLRYLAGSPVKEWHVVSQQGEKSAEDVAMISLAFHDGSIGVIQYLSNGHKSMPKERLEVFAEGKILQLENFRKLKGYGWPGFSKQNLRKQEKGQHACVEAFVKAIQEGGLSPIPFEELVEVTELSIKISNLIRGHDANHS